MQPLDYLTPIRLCSIILIIVMRASQKSGFTIVELLIVIVVIAILAAISIIAYNGIQDRTRQSKINSDLAMLEKAIHAARISASTSLRFITQNTHSGGSCYAKESGTDLAALPPSDGCWTTYNLTLQRISDAGNINVRNLKDPWGRPYYIDENESENPAAMCNRDKVAVYALPHVYNSQAALTNSRLISNYITC